MTVTKHLPKIPCHSFHFFSFLLCIFLIISVTTPAAYSSCDRSYASYGTFPVVTFLQRIQSEALKTFGPKSFDPKLYVDLYLKQDFLFADVAFWELPRVNGIIPKNHFNKFLEDYFGDAGEDLVYTEPVDFVPEPEGFLPKVSNPKVRAWALEVHSLWKNLSRKVSDDVKKDQNSHTLLALPEPLIIPGPSFRELHYWDSYWIIRGLLVSKMYDTAKAIVNNLVWLGDNFDQNLKGARLYYVGRSQPPLLSSMVMEIYTRTGDLELVRKTLLSLIKEHNFWNSGKRIVMIRDLQGHKHALNRYSTLWNRPRPESATIDVELASKFLNVSDKSAFYKKVSSSSMSGWEFSSRWMSNSSDLSTLSTTSIIPVDLNTYLYKTELDIAFFAQKLGDNKTYEKFFEASNARQFAMDSILWNAEKNQWLDYWIRSNHCEDVYQFDVRNQNDQIFASNFIPMWNWRLTSGLGEKSVIVKRIYESFLKSGLLQPAGIATSLVNSGQQWDYPNGWSPLQHIIIEGFSNADSKASFELAQDIAIRWIRTNYAVFNTTGAMHEKYNVERCGKVVGGDENKPQTGFGWSNGVLLALLEEFGWPSNREIECSIELS